ncbi:signal recognition particle receptor beta subunit-domain-containing protein [Syncephalis fuscata]|nr:signal recognition particle receptor beta subunit-domain-containing protein [Syncephalis fuscata]
MTLFSDSYSWWLILLILVGSALAVVLAIGRSKQRRADAILLLGICSSGKTNMLARLASNTWVDTHTSLKENTMLVHLPQSDDQEQKAISVIDVPGHEKLRYQLHHFTPIAKAVVFVIDAARLGKEIRNVAEYLYDILCDQHLIEREVPILLACHKSDLATAYAPARCRSMLEAEIDRIRVTRIAAVDSQLADTTSMGSSSAADQYLGYEGEPFQFDHLPQPVDQVACSSQDDSQGLESVRAWMADINNC